MFGVENENNYLKIVIDYAIFCPAKRGGKYDYLNLQVEDSYARI